MKFRNIYILVGHGLSIVQRAVEAHGGTVEGGDAPGGGAVFNIRLPPPHL